MLKLLKTIWFVLIYLVDWTCPHKRAYWHKVLLGDASVITYDFGVLSVYIWFPELLIYVGQGTGIIAGLFGTYLTYLRIKHVQKQIKALDSAKPDEGDA